MNFGDWLTQQFIDWEKKEGTRRTVSEFADFLGIRQQYASAWMSGKGTPSKKFIPKLAEKLGDEVYVMLGMFPPDPFKNVPAELKEPLEAALSELERILKEKQISVDSDAAKSVAREVFTRHGITIKSIE